MGWTTPAPRRSSGAHDWHSNPECCSRSSCPPRAHLPSGHASTGSTPCSPPWHRDTSTPLDQHEGAACTCSPQRPLRRPMAHQRVGGIHVQAHPETGSSWALVHRAWRCSCCDPWHRRSRCDSRSRRGARNSRRSCPQRAVRTHRTPGAYRRGAPPVPSTGLHRSWNLSWVEHSGLVLSLPARSSSPQSAHVALSTHVTESVGVHRAGARAGPTHEQSAFDARLLLLSTSSSMDLGAQGGETRVVIPLCPVI